MADFLNKINDITGSIGQLGNLLTGGNPYGVRKASYKGVSFGVFDSADARGRNVVVHEFPLRDKPYAEDLGLAKRTITINGFLCGQDYASKRDALIAVFEEEGPGTLVHPWIGSINVALVTPANFTHSAQDMGICYFTANFVETEAPESPGPGLFFPELAGISSVLAEVEACLNFDGLANIIGAVESAIEVVHGFVQGVMSVVNTIYEAVDFVMSIADTVTAFVGQIKSFGDKVSAFIKKLFPDRNYKGSDGGQIANREAVKLLNLCLSSPPYVIPPGLGTERTQVAINKLATSNILRELAGVAGLKAAAWAKPASRTEAKELRELVLEAVDFMLDYASSDAFFRQILKTRGYVLNAIAEAAKAAPDVVEYNEIMIIPALTVVWRRVLRDSMSNNLDVSVDELVKRNKIRHPGFIAPGPLEIRLV